MNSELVVLDNGLVNVYDYKNENEKIVNARELHEFLGIGKDFTSWIKQKLTKYGFEEGIDYFLTLTKIGERKNVVRHEYYLKIDTAKEIAMVENNEQGRNARKYFIEVEKKFKQQNSQPPTTLEALQSMINNMVEQERRMKQLEIEQKEVKDNVLQMKNYLTETPDSKKIEREINAYSRRHGITQQQTRAEVYKIIGDKYGINFKQRVKNKHKSIQEERVTRGKKPYSTSTLKQKYSTMNVIHEEGLVKEMMEVLTGLS